MRRIIRTVAIAAILHIGLSAGRAEAAPIIIGANSSTTFDVIWSQLVGTTELRALGLVTVQVHDGSIDFAFTITNQTALWNERVHSIGFRTDPNATSLSGIDPGTYFQNFALNTTFPSFQTIDICVWSTNNCAGGPQRNNLPGMGTTDTFGFTLNGNFSSGVVLDQFAIQFMGDLGSYQFVGRVPEPATLMLFGMGLLGTAIGMRRRRRD
jgi:hypothetical protein